MALASLERHIYHLPVLPSGARHVLALQAQSSTSRRCLRWAVLGYCVWVAASVAALPSIGCWDWADPAYARYFIPNILCFIGS